ncbi:MAG: hypothetical protein HUU08_00410 [Candidatus Brocadia sp.]|nr:hypothetical protein [Candidatus Brocadia sp.]
MKNKKVYLSPDVKGIYVLQSLKHQNSHSKKDHDIRLEPKETEEEEKRIKELESAKEEAYKKGRIDAERNFTLEVEKLRNEYASLQAMLQNAVRLLTDEIEKIWQECESEIIKLILIISRKIVGYEINHNSINVIKHMTKEVLTSAGEKKIFAIRLSPDDIKKINILEEMKMMDQHIKIVEDGSIIPGGCIVETDFGSLDSQIETRWEEIQKALLGDKNGPTVH